MNVETAALWLLLAGSLGIFTWRMAHLIAPMRRAAPAGRFDRPGLRLWGVLRAAGLHERLLQYRFSGVAHAMIVVSFVVLASAIIQSFGSGLVPGFSLAPVGGDTWIAFLQDAFALVMLIGVGLAAWQRYVRRPARFQGSNAVDATVIYLLIAIIVANTLLEPSLQIVALTSRSAAWRPVCRVIAHWLAVDGLSARRAASAAQAMNWLHVGAILTFLVYIPGSKHRHMLLAWPNIYFRALAPKGQLPQPVEAQPQSRSFHPLSWKDMLDVYSCTECGRCQAACPAYAADLPLSPKSLIMELRDHLLGTQKEQAAPTTLDAVRQETLWACMTCRACMDACPVHIEHVPKIIELRRLLVEAGTVAPMLQSAFTNLQRSGNSIGQSAKTRARWTRELPFKIKDARKEPVDVLWFVGDFASYDPRVQETTRKVARLLNAAGVDFGILYDGEQNSGNDVRRAGEEGLFVTLAQRNIDALSQCSFKRIMTTDPHSLNALAQDYQQFGVRYNVLHYSQFLLELVDSGRLTIKPADGSVVTYHDPCYLGRYNGGFDAPRDLIARAGHRLHEMARCREDSFCCGAGGGRIWSDDAEKERPSENRIREALALGDVRHFIVSCPKDKVMYTAATQSLGVDEDIDVLDLSDLVHA
ncbi:MAG: (Fe-S)-binding protein [Roseiarcus sp.]|jgi:Fe-S oxidoreductase